jgi:hypothetical protein
VPLLSCPRRRHRQRHHQASQSQDIWTNKKRLHLRRKKHHLRVLLTPSLGKLTGTALALVGWLMVPAVCSSAKLFRVSCSRRKILKGSTVSKSSKRCRIASERIRMSTEKVRVTVRPIWLLSSQNNFEKRNYERRRGGRRVTYASSYFYPRGYDSGSSHRHSCGTFIASTSFPIRLIHLPSAYRQQYLYYPPLIPLLQN